MVRNLRVLIRVFVTVFFCLTVLWACEQRELKVGGGERVLFEAEPEEDSDPLALKRVGIAKDLAVSRGLDNFPPNMRPLRSASKDSGVRLWWLVEDYEYVYEETCELITVQKDFVTDLASIPSVARIRHNPADYAEAALVHDWLYAIGLDNERRKADQIFLKLLLQTNIDERRANEIYRAVRIGGNDGYGLEEDFAFFSPNEKQVKLGEQKPKEVFRETICD